MKKLIVLALTAGLLCGFSVKSHAIDYNVKGQWIMSFGYGQNGGFTGGNGQTGYNSYMNPKQDEFDPEQRLRLQLTAAASENVSGTVFFEIGNSRWGTARSGGALGADQSIVEVKNAYLDWAIPDSTFNVRMGIHAPMAPSFALDKPQSFGDDAAGVTVSYQFNENVGLTAFWVRALNDNYTATNTNNIRYSNYMDNVDIGLLALPLTFNGVKLTPWGMMGGIGPNAFADNANNNFGGLETNSLGVSCPFVLSGMVPAWGVVGSDGRTMDQTKLKSYGTAWWGGLTGDFTTWDPFHVAFDFTAGGVQYDNSRLNRAGWMGALLIEYKLDWSIPGLLAWYASGDDDNLGNGSERLPMLDTGGNNNAFSRFAFDGDTHIAREGTVGTGMDGTWGIGARLKDLSFVERLKHTVLINYIGGTNDHNILKELHKANVYPTPNYTGKVVGGIPKAGVNNLYLTDLDSAVEFAVYNEYKMYDNFKILLDASYIALSLDKSQNTWGNSKMNGRSDNVRDAWDVNLSFIYSF